MFALDLLRQAIEDKKKISFVYENRDRFCDPQILGTINKKWQLLTWQTGGRSSKPNSLPGWKRFEVKKNSNINVLEDSFIPQLKSKQDAPFDNIDCIAM